MAHETDPQISEIEKLFDEAARLYNAGELKASLALWQRTLEYCLESKDDDREIKALSNIGALFYTLGDFEQAKRTQRTALARKKARGTSQARQSAGATWASFIKNKVIGRLHSATSKRPDSWRAMQAMRPAKHCI